MVHLVTGDYSIRYAGQDYRHRCAVERKSLADLYQSVTRNRETFKREVMRLAALDRAAIVIEATLETALNHPPPFSEAHPKAVIVTLFAWFARWGVPPVFAGTRELAAAATRQILVKYAEQRSHV